MAARLAACLAASAAAIDLGAADDDLGMPGCACRAADCCPLGTDPPVPACHFASRLKRLSHEFSESVCQAGNRSEHLLCDTLEDLDAFEDYEADLVPGIVYHFGIGTCNASYNRSACPGVPSPTLATYFWKPSGDASKHCLNVSFPVALYSGSPQLRVALACPSFYGMDDESMGDSDLLDEGEETSALAFRFAWGPGEETLCTADEDARIKPWESLADYRYSMCLELEPPEQAALNKGAYPGIGEDARITLVALSLGGTSPCFVVEGDNETQGPLEPRGGKGRDEGALAGSSLPLRIVLAIVVLAALCCIVGMAASTWMHWRETQQAPRLEELRPSPEEEARQPIAFEMSTNVAGSGRTSTPVA